MSDEASNKENPPSPAYERTAVTASAFGLLVLFVSVIAVTYWAGVTKTQRLDEKVVFVISADQIPGRNDVGAPLLKEYKARMMLTMAMSVVVTVSILVLSYCLFSLREAPSMLGLFGSLSIVVFGGFWWFGDGHMFAALGNLLDRVEKFGPTQSGYFPLLKVANVLVVLATFSLIFNLRQKIHPLSDEFNGLGLPADLEDAKDKLRGANHQIALHLYLASTLLIVSVIALHSYYSWPAVLVEGDAGAELRTLATVIAAFYGSGFTLLMVVVLLPATLAVNYRTEAIARVGVAHEPVVVSDDENADPVVTWIKKNGLKPNGYQQGLRILATLGPLAAGPLMEILRFATT